MVLQELINHSSGFPTLIHVPQQFLLISLCFVNCDSLCLLILVCVSNHGDSSLLCVFHRSQDPYRLLIFQSVQLFTCFQDKVEISMPLFFIYQIFFEHFYVPLFCKFQGHDGVKSNFPAITEHFQWKEEDNKQVEQTHIVENVKKKTSYAIGSNWMGNRERLTYMQWLGKLSLGR